MIDAWFAYLDDFRHGHGWHGATSDDQFLTSFNWYDQNGRVLDDDYGWY